VFQISALAHEGLQPLVLRVYEHVAQYQRPAQEPDPRFARQADDGAGRG